MCLRPQGNVFSATFLAEMGIQPSHIKGYPPHMIDEYARWLKEFRERNQSAKEVENSPKPTAPPKRRSQVLATLGKPSKTVRGMSRRGNVSKHSIHCNFCKEKHKNVSYEDFCGTREYSMPCGYKQVMKI